MDVRILHMVRFEKYDDQLFIISGFLSWHDLKEDFKMRLSALAAKHKAKRLLIGRLREEGWIH